MMLSLSEACKTLVEEKQNPHINNAMSAMANVCLAMLKNKRFESMETNKYVAKAMTGAVILYDHVEETGVFYRSKVDIKSIIKYLKKADFDTSGLLATIRYSSKNFRSSSTPSSIRDMFTD